jgi:hypothetical protein
MLFVFYSTKGQVQLEQHHLVESRDRYQVRVPDKERRLSWRNLLRGDVHDGVPQDVLRARRGRQSGYLEMQEWISLFFHPFLWCRVEM